MADRMMGLETEYASIVRGRGLGYEERHAAVDHLVQVAREEFDHLNGMNHRGIFLANGSLLYIDSGCHVELATPECLDPWDLVKYRLAGERTLSHLARQLSTKVEHLTSMELFKCNVDYAVGSDASWGCHESYLYSGEPEDFPEQIIPHLVSRLLFTGAGGWNSLSPGLVFTLSPRVSHLKRKISKDSQTHRGIFHTKDEPLSSGSYHRLHLLCGESLCSETSTWLKVATTSLVVAMAEAGLKPGEAVKLKRSLSAMRKFAADQSCSATARTVHGEPLTALSIQRHYLDQAVFYKQHPCMPSWAENVCIEWKAILDDIEELGPEGVSRVLDWPMKLALFKDQVHRHGFSWDEIVHWNVVIGRICKALDLTSYKGKAVSTDLIGSSRSPIKEEEQQLAPFLVDHGLSWDQLKPFIDLRKKLLQDDWNFGKLGDTSIFDDLDQQGLLNHHVVGVDGIDAATKTPPSRGRAAIRGANVHLFSGTTPIGSCDWDRIYDPGQDRVLDLSNPFESEERWRKTGEMDDLDRQRPRGPRSRMLQALQFSRHMRMPESGS